MIGAVEKIKADALRLTESERAELARALIASLDEEGEELTEAEWEAAWAPELERRMRRLESGESKTTPVEEVMAELRAKYGG